MTKTQDYFEHHQPKPGSFAEMVLPVAECGYKRNPDSSRPPCRRRAGHRGRHSYTEAKAGR